MSTQMSQKKAQVPFFLLLCILNKIFKNNTNNITPLYNIVKSITRFYYNAKI